MNIKIYGKTSMRNPQQKTFKNYINREIYYPEVLIRRNQLLNKQKSRKRKMYMVGTTKEEWGLYFQIMSMVNAIIWNVRSVNTQKAF